VRGLDRSAVLASDPFLFLDLPSFSALRLKRLRIARWSLSGRPVGKLKKREGVRKWRVRTTDLVDAGTAKGARRPRPNRKSWRKQRSFSATVDLFYSQRKIKSKWRERKKGCARKFKKSTGLLPSVYSAVRSII